MKKLIFLFLSLALTFIATAQQLQFHYDFRHSVDPKINRRNFPSVNFEYFKSNDTTGSFLLKMQADFNGDKGNMGQAFFQVSKSVRFWKPKVFLTANYSGGLGIAPPSFGYHISNSFGMGAAHTTFLKGWVLNAGLLYRYNAFPKGSHDVQFNFYFWKGLFNYRLQASGSLVAWTENRDLGIDYTKDLRGKKFAFFGDPQVWWKLNEQFSAGAKFNLFYHVITADSRVQVYPTVGVRWQL